MHHCVCVLAVRRCGYSTPLHVDPLVGFPEHLTFPEFRRRYGALLLEHVDGPSHDDKRVVEEILYIHEVDKNCYKMGLSQVSSRSGVWGWVRGWEIGVDMKKCAHVCVCGVCVLCVCVCVVCVFYFMYKLCGRQTICCRKASGV